MLEIGSSLREARKARGLGLAEVEAATLIRGRYLDALEQERFDLLPGGAYRRSFLREYAEYLGLDGDVYAGEYELRFAAPEPAPPSAPTRRRGAAAGALAADLPLRPIALALAALALVAIAVWQLGGSGGAGRPHTAAPPLHPAARVPARTRTHPTVPAHAAVAATTPVLALLAARGSCWLLVRIGSSAGKTLYEGTLRKGGSVRFGLHRTLWIRFGAPQNLRATIGGHPVTAALPARTGDRSASAAGLRPAR